LFGEQALLIVLQALAFFSFASDYVLKICLFLQHDKQMISQNTYQSIATALHITPAKLVARQRFTAFRFPDLGIAALDFAEFAQSTLFVLAKNANMNCFFCVKFNSNTRPIAFARQRFTAFRFPEFFGAALQFGDFFLSLALHRPMAMPFGGRRFQRGNAFAFSLLFEATQTLSFLGLQALAQAFLSLASFLLLTLTFLALFLQAFLFTTRTGTFLG
jgi:hypothetical protein